MENTSGQIVRTVDAHHHLWRYTAAEYGWIDDSMRILQRDFLADDLVAEMKAADIDGAVAVQARQTVDETRWLLEQAANCDAICGVVGWAPLAEKNLVAVLDAFADKPKLRGLRHIVQGEPDENFILRPDFNDGVKRLRQYGLVYDVLIYERQLPQAIEFVDRHPEQAFVLDHIAKPRIREGIVEPWAERMREMGRREHVWCKVSGLVTEADWSAWTLHSLRPYLDVVVEAFGPQRLMAGSDWPVCLVASGYKRWFDVLKEYFAEYSVAEREAIFGGTAKSVYGLR
ncbi:amidohydrolase family protein [Edaphobacter flagellatus]|uniref:amidohydrolase family protein n=1 Tax=Edaphobacter flagellatus TaxID=1933044 RepID=UPI0021B1A8B2|nr:amidohydrolase family protein [Edaphobacter flagellatus]